jgi:O-succinylbenzoic acid--CoA ligase
VLPHAEIEIRDGAIVVRGRSLMEGYYGAKAIDELNTDDLGYFDDDGFLHVLGRASHTIITGGEKVFPVEVEAALRSTQQVKDVCVVGIADEEWGEVVAAVYVPLPGCSAAVLKQALSAELAAYKHPKIWLETEALPRSDRGKLQRDALQAWVKSALQKP